MNYFKNLIFEKIFFCKKRKKVELIEEENIIKESRKLSSESEVEIIQSS